MEYSLTNFKPFQNVIFVKYCGFKKIHFHSEIIIRDYSPSFLKLKIEFPWKSTTEESDGQAITIFCIKDR